MMKAKPSSPTVAATYRPSNAELDPAELFSIVEPLSVGETVSFSEWLDAELATLEAEFDRFCTPNSVSAAIGR